MSWAGVFLDIHHSKKVSDYLLATTQAMNLIKASADQMSAALNYDVVHEGDHIHTEYDP